MQTPTRRPFRTLLSSIQVGNHVLKSRMLYPNASPHFLQGPEQFPAEGYRTFHASVARNGAAIVTIAEWDNPVQHVGPAEIDFTHMQAFDVTDPSVHNYLSLMAEDIHFYGSKLLVCAEIDWPEGYSLYGGPRLGPPPPDGPPPFDEPIPAELIPEVIESLLGKLRMYRTFGYDGVTMRCDMELLPRGTDRADEYGAGTIENRSRFIREVYAAVKREFGGDFITEAQIAWEMPFGYGPIQSVSVTSDQVMEFCRLIDPDVDIFQIRERDGTRSHPTGYNFEFGDHPAVDFAVRMKAEGITALLAPIGGFQEPAEMEQYLRDGKCDMFGIARAFIVDPEYGQKMLEDRAEDITPCLKCNVCHGKVLEEAEPWVSVCTVNPVFGLEHELPRLVRPVRRRKSVAVIGGGPIGMRAAITAADRGHDVTLYEMSDALGGQLAHADHFAFKWPLRNYRDWLVRQVDKRPVRTELNCTPTPEQVAEQDYDVVLAATGAIPHVPRSIHGMFDPDGRPRYPTCDDMWSREADLGHHVIIVGGSEAGIEMGIHLVRCGHTVTVLTRQDRIASDASSLHYITASFVKELPDGTTLEAPEWERYDNLHTVVRARTTALDGNRVCYLDERGEHREVVGDDIVICGGHRNRLEEAMSYADAAPQFYAIGDCAGAGNVQAGTRQAFARAMII